jgi:hypothetical protein
VFPDETKLQKLRKNDMKFRHLLAVLALFASIDSHAALIHQYELNGSLKDQLGGPDLVANGGTLSPTTYAFKANQGLQLQEKIGAVYSIDMLFHFDSLGSWRKIADFSDLKNDAGLYAWGGDLTFYSLYSTTGKLTALTDTRLTLSRSADAMLNIYQDGQLVMSRKDSYPYSDLSNTYLNFFRDDRGGSEAGPGAVDFIHIYDNALSAAEVSQLVNPSQVAEPASALLIFCGLGMLGIARRRRLV